MTRISNISRRCAQYREPDPDSFCVRRAILPLRSQVSSCINSSLRVSHEGVILFSTGVWTQADNVKASSSNAGIECVSVTPVQTGIHTELLCCRQ